MRLFSVLLAGFVLLSSTGWETDISIAKQKAKTEHKLILLNFSGSDWCVPCIRLHDNIFESPVFKTFSENNLVLVNADFPRLRKNQLSKDQQKKNEKLADQYNPEGLFPNTILMDANEKVLKIWEGYANISPEEFTAQLKRFVDGGN